MPLFDDLIVGREPPPNRRGYSDGDMEDHFPEAAVMLAFAMFLFDEDPSIERVEIHPDGMHGKNFDIRGWLEDKGFNRDESLGRTLYGGIYRNGNHMVIIEPKPGLGDVVAKSSEHVIVAERKGGTINTRHPGQNSKLSRGMSEAVGLLISRPNEGERQVAVVPHAPQTLRLAQRMVPRANAAGIEIALVHHNGEILFVT